MENICCANRVFSMPLHCRLGGAPDPARLKVILISFLNVIPRKTAFFLVTREVISIYPLQALSIRVPAVAPCAVPPPDPFFCVGYIHSPTPIAGVSYVSSASRHSSFSLRICLRGHRCAALRTLRFLAFTGRLSLPYPAVLSPKV